MSESKPIPFIVYTSSGNFEITQQATKFLETLKDENIGILSIVGKYRTGKSFFVNRVLLDSIGGNGFQVGPTINPCTKGIWLWSKVIDQKDQNGNKMKVLIMDTEGFGASTDADKNKDNRIFLFALLLSSFLIYNSVGAINENSLQDMSLLVNLAKSINCKNGSAINSYDQENISDIFPQLLWVIRDFTLQIKDEQGNQMNENQYLEKALQNQKGLSDKVEEKNKIRRLIKHCFQERNCLTLIRPAENEKDLQNLDKIPDNQLRPEFIQKIQKTKKEIFPQVKIKKINQGKTLVNGGILINLAQSYIDIINKGECPNIESTWTSVCNSQNHQFLNETNNYLQKQIEQIENQNDLKLEELEEKKLQLIQQCQQYFIKKAFQSDNQEQMSNFKQQIEKEVVEKFKILESKATSQIIDQIEQIKQGIINQNMLDLQDFTTEMSLSFPDSVKTSFQNFNILFKAFAGNLENDLRFKNQKLQTLLDNEKQENQQLKQKLQEYKQKNEFSNSKIIDDKEFRSDIKKINQHINKIEGSNHKHLDYLNNLSSQLNINENIQVQEIYDQAKKEFQVELDKVIDSNKNIQEVLEKLEQRNNQLEEDNKKLKFQLEECKEQQETPILNDNNQQIQKNLMTQNGQSYLQQQNQQQFSQEEIDKQNDLQKMYNLQQKIIQNQNQKKVQPFDLQQNYETERSLYLKTQREKSHSPILKEV